MQTSNPSEKSLKEAFAARNTWQTNRSSAIFPVRLRARSDLVIAYLNYWALKNRIEDVLRVFRLYDSSGYVVGRQTAKVEGAGASVSIRKSFELQDGFDGMLEVEFISLANLRFPFPAVQAFYTAGNALSTVHSAGRNKNPDEAQSAYEPSLETNWICKFSTGITPFFHVFTSGTPSLPVTLEASVMRPDGTVLVSQTMQSLIRSPFGSRLVALDELFPQLWDGNPPPEGSYCRVSVPQLGLFPRLVVGNLHRATDLLEVTHSFAEQNSADFVVKPLEVELASFIPALKPEELNLSLHSFPTNTPSVIKANLRVQPIGSAKLETRSEPIEWRSGGSNSHLMHYRLKDTDSLISLDLRGNQIPSRLNVSYQFSVRGACAPYSTDIATGAKSCVYPPKHSHWGTGAVGGGFRMVLMARNMSHTPTSTQNSKGTLKLYFENGDTETRVVEIDAEASAFWYVGVSEKSGQDEDVAFVHWLANFDRGSIEMFWVSFAGDGRICGDHAF